MTGITIIVVAVLVIKYYQKIKQFLIEVKTELGKVAWSSRAELMGATVVVIVITAIIAVYVFVIDFLLSGGLRMLFK